MSKAKRIPKLPDLEAMRPVAVQLETARTNDPALQNAEAGDLLRLVPGKRAVVRGTYRGRDCVFRMFLEDNDTSAEREWAEMSRLWPEMQSARYRIPEPFHLSAPNRLIVLEHIPGTPLFTHLWKSHPEGRSQWWPPVAQWLRRATESTETLRCEAHSGWVTRAGRAASSQPFADLKSLEAEILKEITRIGALFEGVDWRTAICHGDYHPNNLIVSGERLTAIDTGGSARMPIYKDMARALVHMGRRGMILSGNRAFGVDRDGITAFARAFDLSVTEEELILPFFIGCEALLRVETRALPPERISQALEMSGALLEDLEKVRRF